MQNFTLIPNTKAKTNKHSTKKLFTKNCPFASFFKINLYLSPFSQFRLQILNENKILRILAPILTYFNTKYFFQKTAQSFFPQIGQYGYLKMQNLTLILNPKAKLKKKHSTKKLFTKNCPFASFFKINLYFNLYKSQFCLQIWNENKILRILVPTLTYFNTKYFFQNTAQFFFFK